MSISSLLAVPFGAIIAAQMETSVLPLMIGFAISGALVFILIQMAERVR